MKKVTASTYLVRYLPIHANNRFDDSDSNTYGNRNQHSPFHVV